MSIKNLLYGGIEIQGNVCIKSWDVEKEDYEVYYEGEYTNSLWGETYFDKEIKYMYCVNNALAIEV